MNFVRIEDFGLKTINMYSDAVSINFDSSDFGNTVTTFNGNNFTAAITFDSPGFGNQDVVFNAPNTGTGYLHNQAADMLKFGNGNDTVTVGDGANTLVLRARQQQCYRWQRR